MNTDEQIKRAIEKHINMYKTVLNKTQEFTEAFKQGHTAGPSTYNTMSGLIDRVRVMTNTKLSQIQDDNAILKKELDYFTNLANIQYNEPTERMTNVKQKINDEIIKLKASIKLRIKFMAIVLQTNSLATSLQNITNKLRSSSLKSLALNTVINTVKAKKMSESAKQITSDYERMIEETGAERSEIEVGSYVMCNYKGNPDTQYLCEVIKINDKKYDVKYADGEVEQDVDKSNISQLPELINVLTEHVKNSARARDSHGGKTRRIRTRTRK